MQKTAITIALAAAAVLLPSISFAALQTSSTIYYPPAFVCYSEAPAAQGLAVYRDDNLDLPIAGNSSVVQPASGCLNTISWATGTFDNSSSTVAGYRIVSPNSFDCDAASYDDCSANNANIPGSSEADFSILAPTSSAPTSTASGTLSASDQFLTYLLLIVDALWFCFAVWLGYYGVRKMFPQLKLA